MLNNKIIGLIGLVVAVIAALALMVYVYLGEADKSVAPVVPTSDYTSQADDGVRISKQSEMGSPVVVPLWVMLLLLAAIISSAAAIVIAYQFYRWRRSVEETGALVPEAWADYLMQAVEYSKSTQQSVETLAEVQIKVKNHIEEGLMRSLKSQEETQTSLLTFQSALDKKEQEIDRLKAGYDAKILQKFLSRLVELHQNITELCKREGVGQSEMISVSTMLLDNLENAGVQKFSPAVGTDFSEYGDSVDPGGGMVLTNDHTKHGQIANVISEGYLIRNDHGEIVLRAAKIKYFNNSEADT